MRLSWALKTGASSSGLHQLEFPEDMLRSDVALYGGWHPVHHAGVGLTGLVERLSHLPHICLLREVVGSGRPARFHTSWWSLMLNRRPRLRNWFAVCASIWRLRMEARFDALVGELRSHGPAPPRRRGGAGSAMIHIVRCVAERTGLPLAQVVCRVWSTARSSLVCASHGIRLCHIGAMLCGHVLVRGVRVPLVPAGPGCIGFVDVGGVPAGVRSS